MKYKKIKKGPVPRSLFYAVCFLYSFITVVSSSDT